MPPPVPRRQLPSPAVVRDRITTPRSARPSAASQPNAPAYTPRGVASTSSMTAIVRSLGAPVIEPAGKSARSAATVRDAVAQPAAHRRDELVHARVGLDAHQLGHLDRAGRADHRQVVAEQVDDHQVLAAELRLAWPAAPRSSASRARVGVARGGALDRAWSRCVRSAADGGVALGRGAEQPGPGARHVVLQEPGVRRGVERRAAAGTPPPGRGPRPPRSGGSGSPRRSCPRAAAPAPGRTPRRTPRGPARPGRGVGVWYQTPSSGDPELRFLPTRRLVVLAPPTAPTGCSNSRTWRGPHPHGVRQVAGPGGRGGRGARRTRGSRTTGRPEPRRRARPPARRRRRRRPPRRGRRRAG